MVKFRTRGHKSTTRSKSGGGYTRTYTPGKYIPPQPARQGPNQTLIPPTPASRGPSTTVVTPIPSQVTYNNEYTPSTTFKIPATVTFVTGMSLVAVNNWKNGKLKQVWAMIWSGTAINDPKNTLGTLGGEVAFVIVMSFIAEINSSTSGVVFALFIGLWMVWSINNADTLVAWTNNIRTQYNVPANQIIQKAG